MWFVINATNKCNLSCKTCLRSKHSVEDVDLENVKLILPKLKRIGFKGLSITGGEPIMHSKFRELVKITVSNGFHFGVVCNGTYYKKYIDVLEPYKKRVWFMVVSLDSHNKEVNDDIRGKGCFDKATTAIKEFKKKGYYVKVSHVVNKKNFQDLDQFVSFALSLGADIVNILGTIRTPENVDLVLDKREKKDLNEILRALTIKYKKKIWIAVSTGYYENMLFCPNLNVFDDITLDFKGNLIFCCDTIHNGAVVGNVEKEGVEKLLQKHMETQNIVKASRIDAIMNHKAEEGITCDFCNKVLETMISN